MIKVAKNIIKDKLLKEMDDLKRERSLVKSSIQTLEKEINKSKKEISHYSTKMNKAKTLLGKEWEEFLPTIISDVSLKRSNAYRKIRTNRSSIETALTKKYKLTNQIIELNTLINLAFPYKKG